MSQCLLRLDAVKAQTGLSRSEIHRRISAGTLPAALIIPGTRIRAWHSAEVDHWVADMAATAPHDAVLENEGA